MAISRSLCHNKKTKKTFFWGGGGVRAQWATPWLRPWHAVLAIPGTANGGKKKVLKQGFQYYDPFTHFTMALL